MAEAIQHRGPDSGGVWCDPEAGVALGHRRLAVIDLTDCGHQPMISSCGRFALVFNGEIYNHLALRQRLIVEGTQFHGHSDTEVLLEAVARWGIEPALRELNGMFAFAVWDRWHKVLHLARDRMGEKPLYYGMNGGRFFFASELKSLRAHPEFRAEIDRTALAQYFRQGYIPAPYSIYRNIRKLPPGSSLSLSLDGRDQSVPEPAAYWSLSTIVQDRAASRLGRSDEDAVGRLDELLGDAVQLRMAADVPLGAFLSGGIDSSTVVALMQSRAAGRVRTFSIGFSESKHDEAIHARAVAKHLGTDHHELYVTPGDALAVVPELPRMFDEPFGDSSQIPTYLVSRMARDQVTVSLSGDGGDELFAGYTRYSNAGWLGAAFRLPPVVRATAARALGGVAKLAGADSPPPLRARAERARRGAGVLADRTLERAYGSLTAYWNQPVVVQRSASSAEDSWHSTPPVLDALHRLMYSDSVRYLPDDILVKVDRASMAVSLEARVPMLDHRVVEFAWGLPLDLKIRNGSSKWILREVLSRYVPRGLFERPKMGFGIPVGEWLTGPLHDWASALLDSRRLESEGYLDAELVSQRWKALCAGEPGHDHAIWIALMFQAWLETELIS